MLSNIIRSPTGARVVPFAVFLGLTFLQDRFGEAGRYWIYFAKTLAGAGMLLAVFRHISELQWKLSWEAIVVGVAVFAVWVGLDGHYPPIDAVYAEYICPLLQKLSLAKSCEAEAVRPWNPNAAFGPGTLLALFFIIVRIVGSTLVVPPLEEVFYRSFVYRFVISKDFESVPLNRFHPVAFFVTAMLFGLAHREWFAGILCAFAYQGLVIRKNRLGDAVTAHAITNFLLGIWIVWKGEWHFW